MPRPPKLSPLPRAFYARDPRTVARELLGKLLIRRDGALTLAGRIVEAEAYLGAIDPGAHAYNGQTLRNTVLFGPPGHAYVYFIYGNHYCTNVSCQPPGHAGCVLLLAIVRERDNGKDLCARSSDIFIADDGLPCPPITATTRINVTSAPLDEWRFVITGNPFVSGKKIGRAHV